MQRNNYVALSITNNSDHYIIFVCKIGLMEE